MRKKALANQTYSSLASKAFATDGSAVDVTDASIAVRREVIPREVSMTQKRQSGVNTFPPVEMASSTPGNSTISDAAFFSLVDDIVECSTVSVPITELVAVLIPGSAMTLFVFKRL